MTDTLDLTVRDWSNLGKLVATRRLSRSLVERLLAEADTWTEAERERRPKTLAERKAEHAPLCGGHLCATCLGFDHAEADERFRVARGG
jgi:hypothetical protein